jgi:hypothetical protein
LISKTVFYLTLTKVVNFLFLALLLNRVPVEMGVGILLIQATSVAALTVSVINPVIYNLLTENKTFNIARSGVSLISLIFLVLFICLILASFFISEVSLLLLIAMAISLISRGLADPLIIIENKINKRLVTILTIVEPLRWATVLFTEEVNTPIAILLLSSPFIADFIIRFPVILTDLKSHNVGKFGKIRLFSYFKNNKKNLSGRYMVIGVVQIEMAVILFLSTKLTEVEAIIFIFAGQIQGFLSILFHPRWYQLLRDVKRSSFNQFQLIIDNLLELYKAHMYIILVIILSFFLFDILNFESILTFYIPYDLPFGFHKKEIIMCIYIGISLTLFRSLFQDINTLSSIIKTNRLIFISYISLGSIFLYLNIVEGVIGLYTLMFSYIAGYVVSFLWVIFNKNKKRIV